MKEILQSIATLNSWVFLYARQDFANLFDDPEQKNIVHLFCDPVKIVKKFNDQGDVESKTYSGNFMMLFSSDLDELSYEDRYEQYIKPLLDNEVGNIEEALKCDYEATFETWEVIEVINLFDYNLDGVIVTYRIRIEE